MDPRTAAPERDDSAGSSVSRVPRAVRPTTISDVARAAGVSVGTVSNVLNNPSIVARTTRQQVEVALRATGFVRDARARSLSGSPGTTVGCVLLDLANPYFAEIARGIEDGLGERGCVAIICSSDVDAARLSRCLHTLLENRVRGVILNAVEEVPAELDGILETGVAVVLLDNPGLRSDVCSVTSDNVTGGRLVAEHLLDLGHRRIALLRHERQIPALDDRVNGAYEAASARGLEPAQVFRDVFFGPADETDGAGQAVDAALAGDDPCTAFVCYSDTAALNVMAELRDRGVAVPDQMSVMGYDDLPFARLLSPALSTVRQPTHSLGRAAAHLVLAEAEPGHQHRQILFTAELIARESTAPPRE
jgi:LacI family transcriptional regulator